MLAGRHGRVLGTHLLRPTLLCAIFFYCYAEQHDDPNQQQEAHCMSQGHLSFSDLPHRANLPFCEKFACSCCNATHALLLRRSALSWLLDEDFSAACREVMTTITCRPCDPYVGTGRSSGLCHGLCQRWYAACKEEFFAFSQPSGDLTPCPRDGQSSLICSRLSELAESGKQLCSLLDLQGSEAEGTCYDGTVPKPLPSCLKTHPAARVKRRKGSTGIQEMRWRTWTKVGMRIIGGGVLAYIVRRWLQGSQPPLFQGHTSQRGQYPGRARRLNE